MYEVVFGGGRLTVQRNEIPLDFEEFLKIFDEASKNASKALTDKPKTNTPETQSVASCAEQNEVEGESTPDMKILAEIAPESLQIESDNSPAVRTRKRRGE